MISRRLGCLPADPAMLARAPQLSAHFMTRLPAPPVLDRHAIPFHPALDENNVLGNCTAVGLANAARAVAALGGYSIAIPTDKVVAFYSASTGYDGTPATDQGGVEALVLAHQARNGFDTGGQTPLVGAWGTFDPRDQNLMRSCIAELGVCYLGVELSVSDQTMNVWDTVAPTSAGDPTPNSWGGHCLCIWDYTGTSDTDTVRLATWGDFKLATWRWVRQRTMEAHGIAWRQLGSPNPQVNYDNLVVDNELFADWLG